MPRPLISLLSGFALITGLFAAEKSAPPPIKIKPLDSPAEASATAPTLARAPDGSVWLAWIESAPGGAIVRSTSLNPTTLRWSAAQRVATGPRILDVDTAPPALAVGPGGRVAVAWTETSAASPETESIFLSSSTDAGLTWTAPTPLTTESKANSLPVLTTLADGRVLAAWLDRRGRTAGDHDVRLYARIVGEDPDRDVLIEARVSEKASPRSWRSPMAALCFPTEPSAKASSATSMSSATGSVAGSTITLSTATNGARRHAPPPVPSSPFPAVAWPPPGSPPPRIARACASPRRPTLARVSCCRST
ncbi:MAG: hypothetical protein CK538_10130 [Opitutia bacterium]|nr:MAG: hypothetical protein CK538_10130 [Opitutae bacterium]